MARWIAVVLLGTVASLGARSQATSCEAAVSTREMESCYSKELAERNAAYSRQLGQVTATQRGQSRRLVLLADSAWRRYRDAECAAQARTVRGGSVASLTVVLCRLDLLEDRMRILDSAYVTMPRGPEKPSRPNP